MKRLAGLLLAAGLVCTSGAAARPRGIEPVRMPELKPAVIDDTLEIGGTEIAAKKVNTRLAVDVGINGTGPYRFIVDSGADTSVIGERLARALRLKPRGTAILNGITETSPVPLALVDSLQLGSTEFSDLHLPVLREVDIGATGMIGLDALVEQRLMLDFETRKISVDDGRTPAPRYMGEIVVTARLKRGQLILTQVRAGGLPLNAVVDTGSEITIGNAALKAAIIKRRNTRLEDVEVTGVTGGTVKLQMAVVDEIRIGSIVLKWVPIAFADVPPFTVFGLDKQPALLLGTDLMAHFRRVSLDFHNRKVRFQLRRCKDQGLVMARSNFATLFSSDQQDGVSCSR